MDLAKLTIQPKDPAAEVIKVMFNPNSYSIEKTVAWHGAAANLLNAPLLRFGGGNSRKLSLELFFDVTDKGGSVDVRTETDRIVKLTRIVAAPDGQRPPVCEIKWGAGKSADFPFDGVLSDLKQRFTLFHESGRPLRAFLTVSFTEFLKVEDDLRPRKTVQEQTAHTVRPNDTLAGIAAQAYGDPKEWRRIADANPQRIGNASALAAGTQLVVPPVA